MPNGGGKAEDGLKSEVRSRRLELGYLPRPTNAYQHLPTTTNGRRDKGLEAAKMEDGRLQMAGRRNLEPRPTGVGPVKIFMVRIGAVGCGLLRFSADWCRSAGSVGSVEREERGSVKRETWRGVVEKDVILVPIAADSCR